MHENKHVRAHLMYAKPQGRQRKSAGSVWGARINSLGRGWPKKAQMSFWESIFKKSFRQHIFGTTAFRPEKNLTYEYCKSNVSSSNMTRSSLVQVKTHVASSLFFQSRRLHWSRWPIMLNNHSRPFLTCLLCVLVVYVVEKCNELQCPHGPHVNWETASSLKLRCVMYVYFVSTDAQSWRSVDLVYRFYQGAGFLSGICPLGQWSVLAV